MSETWKRWEGQVVNGEFPLVRYLGGSSHSAVFLTERRSGAPKKAAIKLIPADPNSAEDQLRRWKQSAKLNYPHLVRVFESGRCELEGTPLLYVVMEAAEEDLSQILPERALTPGEVREMLPPALDALAHLHSKGLVHGRLRPSNILAAGDQVKVSTDSVRVDGELASSPAGVMDGYDPPEAPSGKLTAASDVWSLAITMAEVLTRRRPAWDPSQAAPPALHPGMPEPFQEIARGSLQVDPKQRWKISQIASKLKPSNTATVQTVSSPMTSRTNIETSTSVASNRGIRNLVLGLIAAVALGLVVMALVRTRRSFSPAPLAESRPPTNAAPADTSSAVSAPSREPKPSPTPHANVRSAARTRESAPQGVGAKGAVSQQVLPRVSPSARHTIEGKIKVAVRVDVDPSGIVKDARLVSPGPSKYFARVALEAARDWKFTPPQVQGQPVPSQWILRFGFRRTDTEVVPTQTDP